MSLAQRAAQLDKVASSVRILTIDIETRPMVVYSWGLFKQFHSIDQIVDHGGMLCFAAKWLGEKNTLFYSVEHDGYEVMVQAAWDLLTAADIVITYNGNRFDIPRLNNEFMLAGLGPAAPFKSVDLIKSNRKQFDLASRKLDYLAQRNGAGHKTHHTGFKLWTDCMAGDQRAWVLMEKYNRQDVALTERLYLKLLPWLIDQPHVGVMSGDSNGWRCPHCGSDKIRQHGKKVHAFVRSYQLYRCSKCQGWLRSNFLTGEPQFTRSVRAS